MAQSAIAVRHSSEVAPYDPQQVPRQDGEEIAAVRGLGADRASAVSLGTKEFHKACSVLPSVRVPATASPGTAHRSFGGSLSSAIPDRSHVCVFVCLARGPVANVCPPGRAPLQCWSPRPRPTRWFPKQAATCLVRPAAGVNSSLGQMALRATFPNPIAPCSREVKRQPHPPRDLPSDVRTLDVEPSILLDEASSRLGDRPLLPTAAFAGPSGVPWEPQSAESCTPVTYSANPPSGSAATTKSSIQIPRTGKFEAPQFVLNTEAQGLSELTLWCLQGHWTQSVVLRIWRA